MNRLTFGLGLAGAALVVAGLRPTVAPAQVATVPTTTRPESSVKATVKPAVKATVKPTTPPTTVPAVAPIPAGTAPASTLPLQTREPSAHVSAMFPMLSAAGFMVVLLMLALQWVLTKPGRQGWTL